MFARLMRLLQGKKPAQRKMTRAAADARLCESIDRFAKTVQTYQSRERSKS